MQFVASRDVREGMCVAEAVCDPQGRTLIARGQRLGSHHIARLRKFRIEAIFIDPTHGENVEKPTRSDLREQCEEVLSVSCDKLKSDLSARGLMLDTRTIQKVMDRLVQALLASKDPLVTLLEMSAGSDRLLQHSVNVTVL